MPLAGSDVPLFDLRVQILTRDSAPVNPATVFSIDVEDDQFSPLPGMGFFTSTGSAWSAWVPFTLAAANAAVVRTPNAQASGFPLVLAVGVTPNGASLMQIGVEVRFNVNGVVWSMNPVLLGREYYSGNLAFSGMELLIYLDGAGAPVAQRGRDWNKTFLWDPAASSAIPIGQRPSKLILIDSVNRRGDEIDYVGEAGAALASFGYTAGEFPASTQYRLALTAAGLPGIHAGVAIILNSYDDVGLTNVPALLSAWVAKYFTPYLTAGYASTGVRSIAVQDEPGEYCPDMLTRVIADPVALARFQAWLRGDYVSQQGPAPGASPADYGAAAWADILPIGRGAVRVGNEPLAVKRLYVQSMQWLSWDMSRYTAAAVEQIRVAYSLAGLPPVFSNWNNYRGRFMSPFRGANNPNGGSVDSCYISHDHYEFARMGAGGVLFTEDWRQDGVNFLTSWDMCRLRAAAKAGGVRFGTYQIPLRANPRVGGPLQKFAAAISHGVTTLYHYKIGPGPTEPQVGYAPVDPTAIPNIAASHRFIAPAEAYIVGATLQPTSPKRIALLDPRSAYPWDLRTEAPNVSQCDDNTWSPWLYSMDYLVDDWGRWKAHADNGWPCDYVDEVGVTAGGLADVGVLHVCEQHLRAETRAAILAWCAAGGTLALGPNAMSRDWLDEPDTTLGVLSGIVATARAPAWSHNNADASNGTVAGPGGTATVYGGKATLTGQDGTVYATRSDGAPAILVQPIGLGRIVYYTYNAGMSYWRSWAPHSDGQPPGFSVDLTHGFSQVHRDWITYPALLAGLLPPAACGAREVELVVWKSTLGLAVCLNNWTNGDLPAVSVAIPMNSAPSSVTLTSKTPVASSSYANGTLTASFPLGPADVLLLSGGGVSVEEVGEIGLVGVTEVH